MWNFKWEVGFKRIRKFWFKKHNILPKKKEEVHENVKETVEGAVWSAQILKDNSKRKEEHMTEDCLTCTIDWELINISMNKIEWRTVIRHTRIVSRKLTSKYARIAKKCFGVKKWRGIIFSHRL